MSFFLLYTLAVWLPGLGLWELLSPLLAAAALAEHLGLSFGG